MKIKNMLLMNKQGQMVDLILVCKKHYSKNVTLLIDGEKDTDAAGSYLK
jgi:hypothetical protein